MRFDDTLATILKQPAATLAARAAKWRQLVDLLAQRRAIPDRADLAEALDYLRAHRKDVPTANRKEAALALAGRRVSPMLLRFFGEDHPSVALPIVGTADLSPEEWLELLPSMGPLARSLLRHRRDLHPEVNQALAAFGSSDFVLPGDATGSSSAVEAHDESSEAQIRDLVARIEAYQRERRMTPRDQEIEAAHAGSFRWETGPEGLIIWVEGAPRGPLIGQNIAVIAEDGQAGVDGQAAGAFEKRTPFRNARFSVAGSGPAAGDWRMSGVPFFDQRQGSFLGYRGSARRPRLDEVAQPPLLDESSAMLFGTDLPADSLRQLIHELRTPLNAIVGFAELIDGQYMGPAAASYRSRARTIVDQATKLLSAVDDLDTAARIATQRLVLDESPADIVALVGRLHEAYEHLVHQRKARMVLEIAPNLPAAAVGQATAERMFARLISAAIGLARERETIRASLDIGENGDKDMLCFAIDRPKAIAGQDEAALLDPGYSPDGDWPEAPALGLGFALRLVRNLAEAVGGALVINEQRFFLHLPPLEPAERSTSQSG